MSRKFNYKKIQSQDSIRSKGTEVISNGKSFSRYRKKPKTVLETLPTLAQFNLLRELGADVLNLSLTRRTASELIERLLKKI